MYHPTLGYEMQKASQHFVYNQQMAAYNLFQKVRNLHEAVRDCVRQRDQLPYNTGRERKKVLQLDGNPVLQRESGAGGDSLRFEPGNTLLHQAQTPCRGCTGVGCRV